MKKRILIAVAVVIALVLIAQTGAWAGKLQVGSQAPEAGVAGARPAGTGEFVNPNRLPPAPAAPPAAPTVTKNEFTGDLPAAAPDGATNHYQVTCGSGSTLAAACTVTVTEASAWYWDGTQWVELTVTNGEVVVPAGAPNPFFLVAAP